jgi:hypothetical protein
MNLWTTYGLIGSLLLLAGLFLFGQNRPARLPAFFLCMAGGLLIAVAVFPGLAKAVLPNKIRLFMGSVSFLHLFITMEAVRRNTLKERYALLWIGTGLVLLTFAIYPNVIGWLVQITGMHYTSAIMVVLFSFMILIAFHVSLVLSKFDQEKRQLTQNLALLETRVRVLEQHQTAESECGKPESPDRNLTPEYPTPQNFTVSGS